MSIHHQVPSSFHLSQVVAQLRRSREETHKIRHLGRVRELPSREALEMVLEGLFAALFPTHYGRSDLTDESIAVRSGHHCAQPILRPLKSGLFFGNLFN